MDMIHLSVSGEKNVRILGHHLQHGISKMWSFKLSMIQFQAIRPKLIIMRQNIPVLPTLRPSEGDPLDHTCNNRSAVPDCTSFCHSICYIVLLVEYHEIQCREISYLASPNEEVNCHHISHKLTTETQVQYLSILIHQMACALALVIDFHYQHGPGHPWTCSCLLWSLLVGSVMPLLANLATIYIAVVPLGIK